MTLRTTFGRLAAPVLVAILALVGCSAHRTPPPSPGGNAEVGTSSDTNPQDPATLKQGGNLRLALSGFPSNFNNLHITEIVEIVPSRLGSAAGAKDKRRLDTVRVTYLAENKDKRDRTVGFRSFIDTMIADNDGALFASPTTAPGAPDQLRLMNRLYLAAVLGPVG